MVVAITYCWYDKEIQFQKVIGIYNEDKVHEGIEYIKRTMTYFKHNLIKETKDDNGMYFLEYDNKESFYTGTYEMNEISL